MLSNAKALVVVIALALLTFHVCKPIAVQFMREETFARRRNVWLALTVVAFLSPSFWIWVFAAIVILVPAVRRDANPASLFCLLMFVAPGVNIFVPVVGINTLFPLSPIRLLALLILIPAMFRFRQQLAERGSTRLVDTLFTAFMLLQIVLLIPYETVTTTMRRSFLLVVDTVLVFYVFSRIPNRALLLDVVASLFLASAVMAPIAIFESLRGWLLYPGVAALWGDPNVFSYLLRGDSLRAQAGANHSIGLGYQAAMALGLYLLLRGERPASRACDALILAALGAAVIVSYSRGSWLTAVLVVMLFSILRPDAVRHFTRFAAGACALGVAAFLSPLRDKVLQRLPFIGNVDQDTIEYRQQLADIGWSLVMQNPFFGDPFVVSKMGALKQGQGIIDIVNGYLWVALFNGFVGLGLLVSIFLCAAWTAARRARFGNPDDSTRMIGAALLACFLGTLVFIATAGTGAFTYVLCGLLISFGVMQQRTQAARRNEPAPLNSPVSARLA